MDIVIFAKNKERLSIVYKTQLQLYTDDLARNANQEYYSDSIKAIDVHSIESGKIMRSAPKICRPELGILLRFNKSNKCTYIQLRIGGQVKWENNAVCSQNLQTLKFYIPRMSSGLGKLKEVRPPIRKKSGNKIRERSIYLLNSLVFDKSINF